MPASDTALLKDRAFYRHWHTVDIRVADLDDQRHVNNSVFAVYCEEGRRKYWEPVFPLIRRENLMMFIAHLSIDFHREMNYPGRVDIGTTITRIGNSSLIMAHALFTDKGCHATIEVVVVIGSEQTRKSTPIPDSLRSYLENISQKSD